MGLIVKSILVLLQLPTAFPLSIYGSPLNGLERGFYLSNGLGHQTPESVQKYPIPFPKSETSFNSNLSPILIEPFQIENYPIETYPVETTQIESFISKSDLKNSILESFISEGDLENSIFQNSIFRKPRNLQNLYKKRPGLVDRLRYFLEGKKNKSKRGLKLNADAFLNNPNYEPENIIKKDLESRAAKTDETKLNFPDQRQMAEIRCYDTKMGAFLGSMFCSPDHLIAA